MKFKVTDKTGNEIRQGDVVTSYRGEQARFEKVTRGPIPGKEAKILVCWLDNARDQWEFYASVFHLTVEAVE